MAGGRAAERIWPTAEETSAAAEGGELGGVTGWGKTKRRRRRRRWSSGLAPDFLWLLLLLDGANFWWVLL
jgi:hypothetical protein